MPITVNILITDPTTDLELGLLKALSGQTLASPVPVPPKPEPVAPKAEKPAAKPQPEPEPKAAPAPEPAELPEEQDNSLMPDGPEEDVVGGAAPTLDDAVAKATTLVASGKTAQVKAALAAAGAKRVSELSGAKIAVFLDALDV